MPTRAPREETQPHTSHRNANIIQHHINHTIDTITTPTTPIQTQQVTPNMTPQHTDGYTRPPLPTLAPTDIRVLSHNINTIPTSSPAELGVSFDLYRNLNPSIIGLQETNQNWSKYDETTGRVKQCTERRWPGSKLVTAHCPDKSFRGPNQPGGVAQMILMKITARVTKHGKDPLGRFAWQEILLDGDRTLLIVTAY
jgi:hypothetical protein